MTNESRGIDREKRQETNGCLEESGNRVLNNDVLSMSMSSIYESGDQFPLRNATWSNTVPVVKRDKSEKLNNWKAAGRAIRRMLTKGVLPPGISDSKKNSKNSPLQSVRGTGTERKSCSSIELNDGMNEMYNEYERNQMNTPTTSKLDSKENPTANESTVKCQNAGATQFDSQAPHTVELNGTVSSVLRNLGVLSSSQKQLTERKAFHHARKPRRDFKNTNDCEINNYHKGGTKRPSVKEKEGINWTDLKYRISRLTQRSKHENTEKTVAPDKNATPEAASPILRSCNSCTQNETEDCTVKKNGQCLSQNEETNNIECENSSKCSFSNKIKSKHKHFSNHNNRHSDENILTLGNLPDTTQSECSTNGMDSKTCIGVSATDSSLETLEPRNFEVSSTYELPQNASLRSSSANISSQNSYKDAKQKTSNVESPHSIGEVTNRYRTGNKHELWENRPIFPTANLMFDSSFNDEGFEDQASSSRPLSGEVRCFEIESDNRKMLTQNDTRKEKVQEIINKDIKKKSNVYPYASKSQVISKVTPNCTTDKVSRWAFSGDSVSEGDGSMSDMMDSSSESNHSIPALRQKRDRKKRRHRRELLSIYSAGDREATSSQENLAEKDCPHKSEDICVCMLQFLKEGDRSGPSSVEEKAHLSYDSLPGLLSSSSEEDLQRNRYLKGHRYSSHSERRNSANLQEKFLDSDESDFYDDMPQIDLPRSDTEDKNEPVELSPRELESLPDLRSSSSSSRSGSEADDEFECECDMCQSNHHLIAARSSSWITEDEEEYIGGEPANPYPFPHRGYEPDLSSASDPFEFDISELSPLDLLTMRQGRRDLLEVMFQNVILQMLAVYPDLLNEQAPPPLDPVDMDKIPVITIDASHIANDATCPICLCEFEEGEDGRQLACRHLFHKLCIEAWLVKSGTCPVCRLTLSTKPADQTTGSGEVVS